MPHTSSKTSSLFFLILQFYAALFLALSSIRILTEFTPEILFFWLLGLFIYGGILIKNKWAFLCAIPLNAFFLGSQLIVLTQRFNPSWDGIIGSSVFLILLFFNRKKFLS